MIQRKIFRVICGAVSCLVLLATVACQSASNGEMGETVTQMTQGELHESGRAFSLNIGTYNIAIGQKVGYDVTPIAEDVLSKSLDVIGFQEVDCGAERSEGIDTMQLLSDATGYRYHRFYQAITVGEGAYGLGILSRYPIIQSEMIPLESGGGEQRILARATIDVDGTWIDFFVTHLTFGNNDVRDEQFQAVADIVSQHEGFVLVGDFNTRSFDEYPSFPAAGMVNNHDYSLPTFSKFGITLDNIIYSAKSWSFSKPETLDNGHSDHLMLYATGTYIPKSAETQANAAG